MKNDVIEIPGYDPQIKLTMGGHACCGGCCVDKTVDRSVDMDPHAVKPSKSWKDVGLLSKVWRCRYLVSVPFDFADLYQVCGFSLSNAFGIAWYIFQGRIGYVPQDEKFLQMEKDLINESVPPAR